MNKRRFLSILLILAIIMAWSGTAMGNDWATFKTEFVSRDGRVIDHLNGAISHSEGQGDAMFLAVHHNDRATFDAVWAWTKDNLQVRGSDHLLAWKWGQRKSGRWAIIDLNNATDGDILVAWALLRAGNKWQDDSLVQEASSLATEVLHALQCTWQELVLITPGYFGFNGTDEIIINPSYFIFPAFQDFATAWPDQAGQWQQILADGILILDRLAFTPLALPPDWARLTPETARVDESRSPWFGYDAIRIPLYLALAGQQDALRAYIPFLDTMERIGYLPRGVDLIRSTVHLEPGPAGFYAVLARVAGDLDRETQAESLRKQAIEHLLHESSDYYSFVLYLLADLETGTDVR